MELVALAEGLWRWRAEHPGWTPGHGWEQEVSCYCVEAEDATLLVDPLVERWRELDAVVGRRALPVHVLLSRAGHFRSSQEAHERYGAPVWGHERARERLRGDYRAVDLGDELPGGARVLQYRHVYDGTPLYLSSHRALAPGDLVVSVDGELRVWWVAESEDELTELHERHIPSLRPWLELPVEHVLVSHGAYVEGGRDELAAAFDRLLGTCPSGYSPPLVTSTSGAS
jgi:hypothetical protein